MKTGYLRKSIETVADSYDFPEPSELPTAGTGKPSLIQGPSSDVRRYLNQFADKTIKKLANEIEKESKTGLNDELYR